MKTIRATKGELHQCARRANIDKGWPATGRPAVESDRVGDGIHVPLELVTSTFEAAIVRHPTTNDWVLKVEDDRHLAPSDRALLVDEVKEDWEPTGKPSVVKR